MKRGSTGLSFVLAVDKPAGCTSHDVVARVRRATGERRVGHAGTLDPMATGVLPVLVGPAARLNQYITCDRKCYVADITFGASTDTDDAEGCILHTADVPDEVCDPAFACVFLSRMEGVQKQIPPAYSAIKKGGQKACDEARAGRIIHLDPREIRVHKAELLGIEISPNIVWRVRFDVSKGTYIRALARDIGVALGSYAHLSALRRTSFGSIDESACVLLDTLAKAGDGEAIEHEFALDVVKLLGNRIIFVSDELARRVACGNKIPADEVQLYAYTQLGLANTCACSSGLQVSLDPPAEGEKISVVAHNKLVAIYEFDGASGNYVAKSVFYTGVSRGMRI